MLDSEIIFTVEESPEGGFSARALGYSIHTEGDTLTDLKEMVRDAGNATLRNSSVPG